MLTEELLSPERSPEGRMARRGGLRMALDGQDRADWCRCYVEQAAATPQIVGTHHFHWNDQHAVGRYDGENRQIGIADICQRPYEEFVMAAQRGHARIYNVAAGVAAALETAGRASEPLMMREEFDTRCQGRGFVYAMSHANGIVSKAIAILSATGADPGASIVTAVNFGRDADCPAAVTRGIAGAVSGDSGLAQARVGELDEATAANPHTCLKLSIRGMAGMVLDGLRNEMARARRRTDLLG